ncbi:hypothetical protein BLNAU_18459 [Blattamonas nauphoetae]|uniref:Protein kinase domain-containing protein n=1 Tax=Blattamonas nauphoetae TaxID=2049346 RepID=A0ABQ9X4W3_9EUKA|nr:hypothetical protein BLNAU_18459 [Blattamonas nauphoetae]
MNQVTVFRILQDFLDGLGFLHSRKEAYGDLKPSNILIGRDGTAKLGDFGGVIGVGTQKTSNPAECGTMQFWGPEMFVVGANGGSGSQAGDMWALCSFSPLPCLNQNPQERLSSAELIRSGRLMTILGEETPRSQFIREELDTTKRKVDQLLKEKEQMQQVIDDQAKMIAELTKKPGEIVVENVKGLGGVVAPENVITVWDPRYFRKEGRRLTSLVQAPKSCVGVIDSSRLETCKTSDLLEMAGSSAFYLFWGSVHQNGKEIAFGNRQQPPDNSIVSVELDMNRHTLALILDDRRQPYSLDNIPKKVRFALYLHPKGRSAEIVSLEEVTPLP